MITGKEDLLQSMIEAFIMEKGTEEFYHDASMRTTDTEAKKAFSELASWEHDHMLYIQFLYQAITEDRETMSFEAFRAKVEPSMVEGGIPIKGLEEKLEKPEYTDDKGAIMLALEIEGRAYNLYRKLSESAQDSNVKAFMKDMMNWEMTHIEYLKELQKKIAETS